MTISQEAIEAFALAFWPVNAVSKMESCSGDIAKALEAALPFLSPIAVEGKVAAALSAQPEAVVGEPVGYLFEMHYGNGRWSGTMFAEAINSPPEDVRNVRPLYAALGDASHD